MFDYNYLLICNNNNNNNNNNATQFNQVYLRAEPTALEPITRTARTIYLFTYLLTYSMQQRLLEKLTHSHLVNKFPAFYGTRRFITAITPTYSH
jgi:hypothetical protein